MVVHALATTLGFERTVSRWISGVDAFQHTQATKVIDGNLEGTDGFAASNEMGCDATVSFLLFFAKTGEASIGTQDLFGLDGFEF
jgi:hypothetical protein